MKTKKTTNKINKQNQNNTYKRVQKKFKNKLKWQNKNSTQNKNNTKPRNVS